MKHKKVKKNCFHRQNQLLNLLTMSAINQDQFFKANTVKTMAVLLNVSTKTLSKRIKEVLPHYQQKKIGILMPKELRIIYSELVE